MRDLIPVLGMIFVLGPVATLMFSYTPLGRALVERLRGHANTTDDVVLDLQDEVDRLRDQIASQEHRFDDLHERVDFAERLLLRGSEAQERLGKVATPV